MPPGSAKTTEEGGKDGSMHVKISSPARFYNICSNYCLIHCTNLHILYRYPEKVFFQPESSSFSEANRLAKLTQQPNLPRRKTCTCKKQGSQISLSVLLGSRCLPALAIHAFEPPGRLHRPANQSGGGPTCATCELGPMACSLRTCRGTSSSGTVPHRLFISSESV